MYQSALKILEQTVGPDHLLFVASQNNLAELYRA
ncbi:hypothetical protein L0337_13250 [candidate division KSB1 bacterium]|nr:hypothetical protein [candidate division KSB1 bacterium]